MENLKQFYETKFGRGWFYAEDRIQKSLELIVELNPHKVLDAGCGAGHVAVLIKNQTNAEVYGVDISSGGSKIAASRGVKVTVADLSKHLPFKTASFDVIYCGEVIEHLVDPDSFLEEIRRILVPGGYIVISTPNIASWYNRVLLALGIQPVFTEVSSRANMGKIFKFLGEGSKPVGHLRVFTLTSIKEILSTYGFKVIKVKGTAFLPVKIIHQMDKLVSHIPSISSGFVIVATTVNQ